MDRAALVEKNKTSVDVKNLRADFPMLSSYDEGGKLVYLDNGATTQKPWRVIDIMDFITCSNRMNCVCWMNFRLT